MVLSEVISEEDESASQNETNDISLSSASEGSGNVQKTSAKDAEKEMRYKMINKEEKNVRNARVIVIVAGLACAAAVGAAINIFAHQNDKANFELEYNGFVSSIVSLVLLEIQFNFALMQQMSASVTASAQMTGAVFPNHTEPFFEISGGYVDGMGGVISVAFAPLVKAEKESEWAEYSIDNKGWIEESARLRAIHPGHRDPLHGTIQDHEHNSYGRKVLESDIVTPFIWRFEDGEKVSETFVPGEVLAPLWQQTPAAPYEVNVNLLADERIIDLYTAMEATNQSLLSAHSEITDLFDSLFGPNDKLVKLNPHNFLMEPVYSAFEESPELVGFLIGVTAFKNMMDNVVQEGANNIIAVVSDSCGSRDLTYELNGPISTFLGYEDLHDRTFDKYMHSVLLESYETIVEGMCVHELKVYPSAAFRANYDTNKPAVYTSVIALAFIVTAVLLLIYDRMISRRQEKTMNSAIRTSNLVSSMFPENVRDRLMEDALQDGGKTSILDARGNPISDGIKTRPIADFFPESTIMFADISGFTAWASTREPSQVFLLLETVYGAFDALAKRRGVFKVETIGDCYVAVCGVPKAQKQHAVIMARFARSIHSTMNVLTQELEVVLGPDTAELAFRIGLHSGPITGGVLRGDNARFQLFGDSMNTASRMESTGTRDRVHISKQTADLLIAAGKTHWIKRRDEKIVAKGLGELETFWLVLNKERSEGTSQADETNSVVSDEKSVEEPNAARSLSSKKMTRLIQWNVDVLLRLLKQIAATRSGPASKRHAEHLAPTRSTTSQRLLDEVTDIITLPKFDAETAGKLEDVDSIEMDEEVIVQLSSFVSSIAAMYQDNPFHNFEHASHVTMSVVKLLSRIVAPSNIACDDEGNVHALTLHDHTYGMTSDPLTQFACVFSALIHDVDHQGVPNAQLIAEKADIAAFYEGRSIAEQNSVDLAWELLMDDDYADLRAAIYGGQDEKVRFRQLVVNSVMATDIMDKELKTDRNARWSKAFTEQPAQESPANVINRKATIVIEHLIQASDVAHTMQHWHVYRKWNERLFEETYKAYIEGRTSTDPIANWYKGELGFFDFYIIPLAKKLKECGVFGVSSDEYLNYAMRNRGEWERTGQEVVELMKSQVESRCSGIQKKISLNEGAERERAGQEVFEKIKSQVESHDAKMNLNDGAERERTGQEVVVKVKSQVDSRFSGVDKTMSLRDREGLKGAIYFQ